ncbi:phage terminase large subunit [Tepidimicrobium xylanilyticum]
MKYYTDWKGENPLSGAAIKELIMGEDFLTAWWTVATYIMQMELTPFHKKLMAFQNKHKQTLIMAGRGFGKSYLCNTAYTLTHILRNPYIRMLIATQGLEQSKKFIREMKAYFEKGTILYEIFGDLKGDKWHSLEFNLTRSKPMKVATVTAGSMGADSLIISNHFDICILDDIVGMENSRTKLQRETLKKYVFNVLIPTVKSDKGYGCINAIGTHYHPADFWITLEESGQFEVLKIPTLYKDKDGNLRSIWEKNKSVEELIKTRELIGSINFNMQYQQKVPKEKGGIFRADWINYFYKYENIRDSIYVVIKDKETGIETKEKVRVYMGVDLAISKSTTADSFVIAVIGIGQDTGHIYLLDLFRDKLSFSEQINTIQQYDNKWYMVERIGIESVAYQQALPDELIRTTNLPIRKIKTISDKVTRFSKFSGQWENQKVYLYGRIKDLYALEEELLAFPEGEHDDTIDAFCIAWETATDIRNRPNKITAGGDIGLLGF